jgi:P-type Ca2+ transporter type 2C
MSSRTPTEVFAPPPVEQAWTLPADEVIAGLDSDARIGLSSAEAAARLVRYGRNELVERDRKPVWQLFLEQFTNAMIIVLIVAAIITLLLGDLKDTIVILLIVILNGVVGFVQEYRAEQAMAALKRMTSPTAHVIRDGSTVSVPASEIVPGDIVRLDAGDVVTADMRLL